MKKRTQLNAWLFGNALVATLAVAPAAFAADDERAGYVTADVSTFALIPKSGDRVVNAMALRLSRPVGGRAVMLSLDAPSHGLPPAPREARILGLRLPAFIALGLGGLGAGGAIATGVAAGNRGNDPRSCDSRCTDHAVSNRTLLLTAGVLTGVAAAGVGLGVALIIGEPGRSERLRLRGAGAALALGPRPTLGFGFSSQKAVAKVGWRF